jgi:putative hydrolase of HD superfamily
MTAGGGSWTTHRVTRQQVLARMAPIEAALPAIWPFIIDVVERFSALGAIAADV